MESLWETIKYAILGLLQGFTEPIPISSSGHLIIAQRLFGLEIEGLSFEVLVNFASLIAVLLIYRQDIVRLTVNGTAYLTKRDPSCRGDFMFIIYLIIATIPAGVIGVLFNDFISSRLKGIHVIGITLLVTAVALWLIRNLKGRKGDKQITLKDAVIVGLAQAVALIPGVSRSGATIVAAMGLGMKQETALRFSFFMYIPVSLGGMILEAGDIVKDPDLNRLLLPYGAAFLLSLIATYFSLRWFMNIMKKGNLVYFSIYCLIVGLAVLFFL
ncbi:undecaprenyl-diphosphate phosphatase [Paenibacillus sp. J2TS4]|uniref:undecaprenyl-diphosphate phosphatase n=1 Tax=Paenibacillus sp. J2TS4 TaxID=2807194 RepID=UPI001AFDC036|nr:undecaprenyl-diphosphate phosphatase [Paenibacillus sp. J2TS4]GIP33924.1 undecaprenyl-diphosphatase 2 [Paenibacillus sp. J2TS4]